MTVDLHQLKMHREVAHIDTRRTLELLAMCEELLDAGHDVATVAEAVDLPTQGNVSKVQRLREALDVSRAWPDDALELAAKYGADWHALREPARWWRIRKVERDEVVGFALEFVEQHSRWPTTDSFRRRFGFAVGNPVPGEGVPGQGQLGGME